MAVPTKGFVTNIALQEMQGGGTPINPLTATIKVALVDNTYEGDPDDEVADAGTTTDVESAEINVTGYTRGYGGAGRKTLSNKVIVKDNARNSAYFDNTVDLTWTSLGAGATIIGAVLLIEDHLGVAGNDTETRVTHFLKAGANIETNGSDVKIVFGTFGIHELRNT